MSDGSDAGSSSSDTAISSVRGVTGILSERRLALFNNLLLAHAHNMPRKKGMRETWQGPERELEDVEGSKECD